MGLSADDFIKLDRRFERASAGDSSEFWADALADRDTPRDWNWLRSRSRVVALLAQAGSGKSVEFMHQVDEERAAGREAFFLRVERLCKGRLEDAHESTDCKDRFERWAKGNQPAEFFLDAVDEAKLPQASSARPLRDALRQLKFALGPHLRRVSLFVSCRSSEWFDDVEQKALDEFAQSVSEASTAADPITVFNASFAPLDLARIRLLARDRGGEEAITALIESEAITDIITPLDANLYLDTYEQYRNTPELAERLAWRGSLLDTSIRRRLFEEGGENRRSRLEFGAALRAAQLLAFASVVMQSFDIAIGGPRKDCVDPSELLAGGYMGLSPEGIRQLLACALFVPSGQARVRFYRREARDMLAAQWLRDRIEEGASAFALVERFIKPAFGTPQVPNAYGSMLAWLASYDPVTRRRMIEAAPQWIIEDGDTRSLALEDRIAALDQHFQLGPHRFHGEFAFDVNELRRFAQPELEDPIVAYLTTPPTGDLFDHLMQLVEAGKYASAAPALVALLKDFSLGAGERMFAIRALIACGSIDDLRDVALHFGATGGPVISSKETFAFGRNDRFLLDLVFATYPKVIGCKETLRLLAQLRGRDYNHDASSLSSWLAAAVPATELEDWLLGLDTLCFPLPAKDRKPFGHDMPTMHRRATILLKGLLEIAARYISEAPRFDPERDLLVFDHIRNADHLGASFAMSRRGSPVPASLSSNAQFRRALYRRLATKEELKATAFAYFDELDWQSYQDGADQDDLGWFLEQYRSSTGAEREDYGHSATWIAYRLGRIQRLRARFAIAGVALSQRKPDWTLAHQAMLEPLLAPIRRYRAQRRWRTRDEGAHALAARLSAKTKLKFSIWKNWTGLRNGTALGLLSRLIFRDSFDSPSETELTKIYGKRLGGALVEGARSHARSYHPIDRGRSIYPSDMLAQAGYRYEANADLAMHSLDAASALHAALLFATDWPDWASKLAVDHPELWADLVVPLIVREIETAPEIPQSTYTRFLSTVSYRDDEVRKPIAAPLFAAISIIRVIDGVDIERLVDILRADPSLAGPVARLASRQAREAWHEGSVSRALSWLPFWAEADDAGLRALLAWMETDPELITEGLKIYTRLHGDHSSLSPAPIAIRRRFAELAYGHIRPQDDPPLKEGVHSVTERDDLQQLRGNVGELLAANFDEDERQALEQILKLYVEPVSMRWADRWRNRYAQQSVKPRAWSHAAVIEARDLLAAAPRSGDELYAQISDMIGELELELVNSEFDLRGLFPSSILESDFRAWLGHTLDSRRRPWFSIVQETETSSANRHDLRIELRGTGNALVIIEIKLVHRWTYAELIEKFRTQLVEQYLINPRSRHGIYLLVDLGEKPKGQMEDGSKPSSERIAEMVNQEAAEIASPGGPIARAQVFTIKPSRRNLRREKKKRAARARELPVASKVRSAPTGAGLPNPIHDPAQKKD